MRSFAARDAGGATALGILSVGLMAVIAGFAVDTASLYRYRNMLQLAADAAAQGGVVELTRGDDAAAALQAARKMTEMNLPAARHGRLIGDHGTDLQALVYDPSTGQVAPPTADTPANAVLVRLQRGSGTDNPLPTFLLGLVGRDVWSVSATAVVALTPTQRCENAEGIVARGAVTLGDTPQLGANLCLHSQSAITLPYGAAVAEGVRLSLPDPAACAEACAPGAQPHLRPAALNLVMPGTRDHVARLAAGFLDPGVTLPEELAFFGTKNMAGDPEALREVGLDAENVRVGDVVQMSPLQFSQLRERPAGLIYDVRCDTVENDPRPLWERSLMLIGADEGPTLRDLALITDCAVEMDDFVRIEGALIMLTGPGPALITALPGATLGDPEAACNPARRVRLMTLGDLDLQPGLATSNLSVVAGGNLVLDSDPQVARAVHQGLVIHTGGAVTARGSHSFARCTDAADPLLPPVKVIVNVMPDLDGFLPPTEPLRPRPKADMPGNAAKPLSAPRPLTRTVPAT